jgi:hypothetical protein
VEDTEALTARVRPVSESRDGPSSKPPLRRSVVGTVPTSGRARRRGFAPASFDLEAVLCDRRAPVRICESCDAVCIEDAWYQADLITFAWRVDPHVSHAHTICPSALPAPCRACRSRARDRRLASAGKADPGTRRTHSESHAAFRFLGCPLGVDSPYGQPHRKDPQVVGGREEALTAPALETSKMS